MNACRAVKIISGPALAAMAIATGRVSDGEERDVVVASVARQTSAQRVAGVVTRCGLLQDVVKEKVAEDEEEEGDDDDDERENVGTHGKPMVRSAPTFVQGCIRKGATNKAEKKVKTRNEGRSLPVFERV